MPKTKQTMIRKDLACAKSFRTPAEALVVLTYYQKKVILSGNVRKDLAYAKSFGTPAEALVVLTYYQKEVILSGNVKKGISLH